MLGTVGDLVEDVVVRVHGPIHAGADTDAHITRRRGGSAANMAVSVVRAGGRSRFIGQVGDDVLGEQLVQALVDAGVHPVVRREGRTGSIVVVVDEAGERSFLRDRAACGQLDHPDPTWLDDLTVLHVPLYSLVEDEPLARSARSMVGWARVRGILVSVDASSSSVIDHHGATAITAMIAELEPDVLLCNGDECDSLGGEALVAAIGARVTVVKRGGEDALVLDRSDPSIDPTWVSVPAVRVADVRDTTGAGDAFAAGFLDAFSTGADAVGAARRGHSVAAELIKSLTHSDA